MSSTTHQFRYLKNVVDTQLRLLPAEPWNCQVTWPAFASKEDRSRWQADPSTDHVFYTLIEPYNPHVRVGHDNPARWAHGFVADYDSEKLVGKTTAEVVAMIDAQAKKHGALQRPNWVSRTLGGKARCVWLFEAPVPADNDSIYRAFVAEFVKSHAVDKLLTGGRDTTGDRAVQVFEIGHDWTQIEQVPVAEAITEKFFYDASRKAALRDMEGSFNIPIDVVAEEVERQFPGRWTGAFELGARGPLFWIDDGINRIGAVVSENGMVCYSHRAGKTFVPWVEIFGRSFAEKYEAKALDLLTSNVFFDGKSYWEHNPVNGESLSMTETVLKRQLRVHGVKDERAKKQTSSQMDEVMHYIETAKRIKAAVPVIHYKPGPLELWPGEIFLNTRPRKAVLPADDGDPSRWPWLHQLVNNLFDPYTDPSTGVEAKQYFFSWLQRFYRAGLEFSGDQGHGLIIVGDAGQGKTFLGSKVVAGLVGGAEDVSSILAGKTNFNAALGSSPLGLIDDTTSSADYASKRAFGELLKSHIANGVINYQPKYLDAKRLPWTGRIIVTCNADSDSLDVIPSLDNSMQDKLMLFKTSTYRHPFRSNDENHAIVQRELPFFARWLLDYTPPKEILGDPRFGFKPFHHPFIAQAALDANPDRAIIDILEILGKELAESGTSSFQGTTGDLYGLLCRTFGTRDLMRGQSVQKLGKMLQKIHGQYPPLHKSTKRHHELDWTRQYTEEAA